MTGVPVLATWSNGEPQVDGVLEAGIFAEEWVGHGEMMQRLPRLAPAGKRRSSGGQPLYTLLYKV